MTLAGIGTLWLHRVIRHSNSITVRMVGHGSSDNASSYGVYAFGLLPRWTALRDSITLTAYYDAGLDMRGCTVIGLSQSGRTRDVVDYVARARSAGAFTVALTNDVGSDLAGASEAVLPLAAGPERSVAASKTYLNQIAALGLAAGVEPDAVLGHRAARGVDDGAGRAAQQFDLQLFWSEIHVNPGRKLHRRRLEHFEIIDGSSEFDVSYKNFCLSIFD